LTYQAAAKNTSAAAPTRGARLESNTSPVSENASAGVQVNSPWLSENRTATSAGSPHFMKPGP
jgi:hypothetical protein